MLQTVILETENPMSLSIGDADPDELLNIKNISGLTAEGVTLFTGDFSKEGGYYQGRRSGQRNPVITFKLNQDYAGDIDVSDIRDLLYTNFLEPALDSDGVQIRLVDDRRPDRYLTAYTETMPTEVFTNRPELQVSMVCVDPYLKSVDAVSDSSGGWFTLPITYEGSAKTGMVFQIAVLSETDYVYIENNGKIMTLYGPFITGDVLDINSILRERYIELNGVRRIAVLQAGSSWLELRRGVNNIAVSGDGGSLFASMTAYEYRAAWWGI